MHAYIHTNPTVKEIKGLLTQIIIRVLLNHISKNTSLSQPGQKMYKFKNV